MTSFLRLFLLVALTALGAFAPPAHAENPALEMLLSQPAPQQADSADATPTAAMPSFPGIPPATNPPVAINAPLDLTPHDLPAFVDLSRLKHVDLPLPPAVQRLDAGATPTQPDGQASAGVAPAAATATPEPVMQLPLGRPPVAADAPAPATLSSQVAAFAPVPQMPPGAPLSLVPGNAALPTLRLPPAADIADDDDDGTGPGSVETQTDVVDVTCLKPELLDLIKKTGEFFQAIPVITSGYRDHGRRGSLHRRCMAADFIVPGVSQHQLVAFLKHLPGAGGIGTYCTTKAVHLDIGEPRQWGYCGVRRTYFSLR